MTELSHLHHRSKLVAINMVMFNSNWFYYILILWFDRLRLGGGSDSSSDSGGIRDSLLILGFLRVFIPGLVFLVGCTILRDML